jgi:hypothetical protein
MIKVENYSITLIKGQPIITYTWLKRHSRKIQINVLYDCTDDMLHLCCLIHTQGAQETQEQARQF